MIELKTANLIEASMSTLQYELSKKKHFIGCGCLTNLTALA
jgi:hypothetical protein